MTRISAERAGDDVRELRRLLRLNPETNEFKQVFGSVPAGDAQIAVRTRSQAQIMSLIFRGEGSAGGTHHGGANHSRTAIR